MKILRILLPLLLLTSCLQQVKEKVRTLMGKGSTPAVTQETTEEPEYIPEPPPSIEKDQIVQVSPKERLLSLFEQFNRSPDATIAGLVEEEFKKNKSVFNQKIDLPLKSVLNRSIPNIQQGDYITLQLLTQLLSQLTGENKDHLFNVLANYFESAPAQLADLMSKRSEDKFCTFANQVPSSISPEDKRNFLEARMNAIAVAKESVGSNILALNYLDACLKTLSLQLGSSPQDSTSNTSEPEPEPTSTDQASPTTTP